MKTCISLFSFICIFALSTISAAEPPSAQSIIEKYQTATSIQDLSSVLTYKNISKKGRVQERQLEQFILRTDEGKNTYNLLLKFVYPTDVAGTSTLTIQHEATEDDQWLYLPILQRARRISASKKADRFMGTEMTYEDLSNYLTEPVADYNYNYAGEKNIDGRNCFYIEATPKNGLVTQYSKRLLWIDQATHLLVHSEFYDQKGQLLKTYTASDIRKVGSNGRHHRAHRIVLDNRQSGNRTEVTYQGFKINEGVDPSMFAKAYLERL